MGFTSRRKREISFHEIFHWLWGPQRLLFKGQREVHLPALQGLRREYISKDEVKVIWKYISTQSFISWSGV